MFKLSHDYIHLTCQQSNAQNSPSQASPVRELRTSRCSRWIWKMQRNQRSNCQHPLDHRKAREFQKNIFCFTDYTKAFDCVDHNKLENSSKDGNTRPPDLPPEKPVCRSRRNRSGHGTMDWFKIGKGVHQGCIMSPCLFNLYAEYIIRSAGCTMEDGMEIP